MPKKAACGRRLAKRRALTRSRRPNPGFSGWLLPIADCRFVARSDVFPQLRCAARDDLALEGNEDHDVPMGDNTWTMHLVMPYDPASRRRVMHRTAIAGVEAVLQPQR